MRPTSGESRSGDGLHVSEVTEVGFLTGKSNPRSTVIFTDGLAGLGGCGNGLDEGGLHAFERRTLYFRSLLFGIHHFGLDPGGGVT